METTFCKDSSDSPNRSSLSSKRLTPAANDEFGRLLPLRSISDVDHGIALDACNRSSAYYTGGKYGSNFYLLRFRVLLCVAYLHTSKVMSSLRSSVQASAQCRWISFPSLSFSLQRVIDDQPDTPGLTDIESPAVLAKLFAVVITNEWISLRLGV